MSKAERRWCFLYSAVLVVLTGAPYVIGYFAQGDAWVFSGFVFGVDDGNSYIAKMLSGASGAWLFRTPYTTMPQRGVLAFLPYILLGKLAQGESLHEQLVALFHVFRSAAIFFEVWAVYRFASLFLAEQNWRRWVTILATAGGGLGWLLIVLGQGTWLGSLPLDLHSPESFGFLAIYGLPHLVLARGLLLLGLVHYLESEAAPRRPWEGGTAWLALGLVQPLTVITGYAVLAAHLVLVTLRSSKGAVKASLMKWGTAAAKVVLVSSPMVIYNAIAFATDPYLRAWTSQNRILSPPPMHYLVAYGLVLVPAAYGLWRELKAREPHRWLPAGWALALPALAYAPVNLQRRLPDGVWVSLAILAGIGFRAWARDNRLRRLIATALIVASLPTTFILLAGGAEAALRPGEPVFVPRDEVQAFDWLREHGREGAVVLASFETGNALPAWAPMRVVIGHGPESAGIEELRPQVERLFRATTDDAFRNAFLRENRIEFIFYGPHEAALGGWRPEPSSLFDEVYSLNGYSIYEVEE